MLLSFLYILNFLNNEYIEFNDSFVSKKGEINTNSTSAYTLFYKKRPYYNPIKEERDATLESKKRMTYKFNGNHKTDVYDLNSVEHNLDNKSYPKTIKRFKSVPNSKGRLHPSQKPVALLKYLIKTYTKENDIVLDFTMGSGSTGVACMETNRKFIGIELDEKYYDIAKQRINEASEQKD